jgi:hypothetical protein
MAEKLHHFLAGPRHRGPPTRCFRILLKSANLFPVENEVQHPLLSLRGLPKGVSFPAKQYRLGIFGESLPKNFNQRLLEGRGPSLPNLRWADCTSFTPIC